MKEQLWKFKILLSHSQSLSVNISKIKIGSLFFLDSLLFSNDFAQLWNSLVFEVLLSPKQSVRDML